MNEVVLQNSKSKLCVTWKDGSLVCNEVGKQDDQLYEECFFLLLLFALFLLGGGGWREGGCVTYFTNIELTILIMFLWK